MTISVHHFLASVMYLSIFGPGSCNEKSQIVLQGYNSKVTVAIG